MFGRRGMGGLLALTALGGCTPRMRALEASLMPTAGEAAALYSVAKGIAEVAALAEPEIAPVLGAIIAVCDPLVAALETALSGSTSGVAATLAAQTRTLLLAAAPAVRVVGNPVVAAKG